MPSLSSLLSCLLFSLFHNALSQGPSPPIAPIARLPPRIPPVHVPPPVPAPGTGTIPPPPSLPRLAQARAQVIGAFGQDCTPSSGDYPEACPTIGQDLLSRSGKIECIHNFDCCTCGAMICGPDCSDLVCNGDSGCYGVKDIRLSGGISGTNINCNGDVSCQNTGMIGTNIASILCSGDNSCSYSIFNLECLPSIGCILECVGDASCEADPLIPALNAIYTIENSNGMSCSASACKYATFNLLTNIGGSIICGAYDACLSSKIMATNINSIMCGGRDACKDANILIINPKQGFSLSCQSIYSCLGLRLEILITDPLITEFYRISCGAMNACENAQITITKQLPLNTIITTSGSNDLTIAELSCGGYRACFNTHFYLTPNIAFTQCGCAGGMTQSCDGLLGVESCAQGISKIECNGNSCRGMSETIINPRDHFELICSDPNSCKDYTLTIKIEDSPRAPSILNGVTCGSPDACNGMRINIINLKSDATINPIPAGTISCGTTNSCRNTIIVTHNADILSIVCGDTTSCAGCQQWTNMKYNACDSASI